MKKIFFSLLLALLSMGASAQERRPIDNQHPMWMIHVDVWNSADPQKIIDLIPDNIKPYVCMNLSLSCSYDKNDNMYKMPRSAVRTYKSWASVCQQNGLWFTCQPASGGHTHIQDDDLETFEYFFKAYPNFLGWNYAEQFWGFDEAGDKSSSTQASRIALFAKLVPMSHKYGGFLTVSFCGNIWSHALNPVGMMKRNPELLQACRDYPEAILWLYKYTTSSCWYNNESVTWGPFVAGLATNYGVRYDNCGWNGAIDAIYGSNSGKTYPGAAGIGTVMEQTCVNGGAVWDGPELIWTEDFQNLNNTQVNGYTRRNWGTFPNFRGVWLDMFGKIIDGTMYIPTREEVVNKTKIVVINDVTSGNDEDKYAAWGSLYEGLYQQEDPFNRGDGRWMNNFCYFKKTGRYGAIPIVPELADELSRKITAQVKKSQQSSRWSTTSKKTTEFNSRYSSVSEGDMYVNRFRNQLVTYSPYTYVNGKKGSTATIPLKYNTCTSLELQYDVMSSGVIREYENSIDFYLNNFRADSSTVRFDYITINGVTSKPTYSVKKRTGYISEVETSYDQANQKYTMTVVHVGPIDVSVNCSGANSRTATDAIPKATQLPTPKQPEAYKGPIIIEAENMDYRAVSKVALTNSGWWAPEYEEFAGLGYVEMGKGTGASLRHELKLAEGGEYDIIVRYCNTTKAGPLQLTVNGTANSVQLDKVDRNDWHKVKLSANLQAGTNTLIINNTGATSPTIDQIIYKPKGTPDEKFLITIKDVPHGRLVADVKEAAEGQQVTLTAIPDKGYALKALKLINSVYYSMAATIAFDDAGSITFTMPEDNVTIKPIFGSESSSFKLNFADVVGGAMPEGWQCIQENGEVHAYPDTYGLGARTMTGFGGYQGKALYWRNDRAEYGTVDGYPLTLDPGEYKLSFAMAAWKENPAYKVVVQNVDDGRIIAESDVYDTTVNANGNMSADVSGAEMHDFTFNVPETANYVVKFVDQTQWGGFHEFLLLECSLLDPAALGVDDAVIVKPNVPVGIYTPAGIKISRMQPGLNIIVNEDGSVQKVFSK